MYKVKLILINSKIKILKPDCTKQSNKCKLKLRKKIKIKYLNNLMLNELVCVLYMGKNITFMLLNNKYSKRNKLLKLIRTKFY